MLINGPVNIVKLNGNANGVNKTLNIFFDFHNKISKCDQEPNINIEKYLENKFNNSKSRLDFYLEITKSNFENSNFAKNSYLEEVSKLFKNNKQLFPFVKFHCIDIREEESSYDTCIENICNIIENSLDANLSNSEIDEINNNLNKIKKNIIQLKINIASLFNNQTLNNYIQNFINHKIDLIIKLIKKIKKEVKMKIPNDRFNKSVKYGTHYNVYYKIGSLILQIYLYIMDTHFINKFLNNDKTTDGIVYAGGSHCVDYIFILVKYFDFKIVNVSNNSNDTNFIQNITEKINNIKSPFILEKYFIPESIKQCSLEI
jgi:hypothetical protein